MEHEEKLETISEETSGDQDTVETTETEVDASADAQSTEVEDDSLPEKFRGKSAKEIAEAYANLEKKLGEISSERSHREREAEALANRLSQLESQVQQRQAQEEEADPLEGLEQEFLEQPEKAFRKAVEHVKESVKKTRKELQLESKAQAAAVHYERLKKENPDFSELEPEMIRLSRELGSMVRPEEMNTPKAIDILYQLAKANNLSKYTSEAAAKAGKASDLVKEEKRRARSESASNGASASSRNFADLSLEEMKRKLGVTDND